MNKQLDKYMQWDIEMQGLVDEQQLILSEAVFLFTGELWSKNRGLLKDKKFNHLAIIRLLLMF